MEFVVTAQWDGDGEMVVQRRKSVVQIMQYVG
jgi:hypothetical protein